MNYNEASDKMNLKRIYIKENIENTYISWEEILSHDVI